MVGKCATRPPVPPHLCATLPLRVTLPPVPWDERLEESSDGSSWFPIFGHVSFIQCVCIYMCVCVYLLYIYIHIYLLWIYIYIYIYIPRSLSMYGCWTLVWIASIWCVETCHQIKLAEIVIKEPWDTPQRAIPKRAGKFKKNKIQKHSKKIHNKSNCSPQLSSSLASAASCFSALLQLLFIPPLPFWKVASAQQIPLRQMFSWNLPRWLLSNSWAMKAVSFLTYPHLSILFPHMVMNFRQFLLPMLFLVGECSAECFLIETWVFLASDMFKINSLFETKGAEGIQVDERFWWTSHLSPRSTHSR